MAVGKRCVIHLEKELLNTMSHKSLSSTAILRSTAVSMYNNPENLEGFSCWKFRIFVTPVVKMKIT